MQSSVQDPEPARNRAVAFCGILGLCLVLTNFVLDVCRRYDFESEKLDAKRQLGIAEARLEDASLLLSEVNLGREDFRADLESLDSRFASFSALADKLLEQPRPRIEPQIEDQNLAAALVAVEGPGGLPIPVSAVDELDQLFEATVDDLQEAYDLAGEDQFVRQFLTNRLNATPQTWNVKDILLDLESEFGYTPLPEEKQLLEIKIESFRQAAHSAYSRYVMGLNASMLDRIRSGSFDRLEGIPEAEQDLLQPVEPGQIFAQSLHGSNRFVWVRQDYPELYRQDLLHKYIPVALLRNLQAFFRERSGQ